MNISKLLKITALSCVAVFSINNNIVNAADRMDIDDDNNNGNIEIVINNNDDINDLLLNFNMMDFDEHDQAVLRGIQHLQNLGQLTFITTINNCNVLAFPNDRTILITNGNNFYIYKNGIVTVCYNNTSPDGDTDIMNAQNEYQLQENIRNRFMNINNAFRQGGVNNIMNYNNSDNIIWQTINNALRHNELTGRYEVIYD